MPPWGATKQPKNSPTTQRFNSRAREGRDAKCLRRQKERIVSTHAPARGATGQIKNKLCNHRCFNSRAREGRDPRTHKRVQKPKPFQLTRPRGARLFISSIFVIYNFVSTHAPARGATLALSLARPEPPVSTHAPARGATSKETINYDGTWVSTHAPARGATVPATRARGRPSVSTHAPARGATIPVTLYLQA